MRRSPFQGPVVVSVRGIRVALRFSEAELVRIRPVDGERKIGVILQ
jgi:Fe2+ transport system protein FeoA